MADQDFFADDAEARKAYETKPFNIEGARAKATKWLDKIGEQIGSGATRGRRNWSNENNTFKLTLPFSHNGNNTVHRTADKVSKYLEDFKNAITGGKFDDSIRAHYEGVGEEGSAPKAPRAPRKPREGGGSTGWSEERRAKFAATMAARKAAK